MSAKKARLDSSGTAAPLTRLVAHVRAGDCIGPGSGVPHAIEDVATGERIPLSAPSCKCDRFYYCPEHKAPAWSFKTIPGYVIVSDLCFHPKEAIVFAALVKRLIECDVKIQATSNESWNSVHVPARYGTRAAELRVAFEAGKSFQYDVEGYR